MTRQRCPARLRPGRHASSYLLCSRHRGHHGDHRSGRAHWTDFDHVPDDLAIVDPGGATTPVLQLDRDDPDGGVALALFRV